MTAENQRLAVAASFAERYYNTLVESPSSLPQFYAPTASADHLSHKVKGGSDIAKLLAVTHGSKHYATVKVESIRVTCTTTGNLVANVSGSLNFSGQQAPQPFTHEVELRETQPRCYAITRDVFRHKKAPNTNQQTMDWASATPLMFSSANKKAEVAMEPLQQPASTAETQESLAKAEASTTSHKSHKSATPAMKPAAESAQPAEPAVDLSKLSFAERLRLTKGQQAQPAAAKAPIRVLAVSDKAAAADVEVTKPAKKGDKKGDKKADHKGENKQEKKPQRVKDEKKPEHPKEEKKPREDKKDKDAAAPAKPKKASARAAQPLVFYDIVVKGLPAHATEAQVRAMVDPSVAVSKVKVESKASRRDPTDTRTFAFVQLERDGLTESVQTVVVRVVEHAARERLLGEGVVMEEVHERKAAAATKP